MQNDKLVFLRCKFVGRKNLIATVRCYYNKDTFEYDHVNHLYDNGKEATMEGYYTFDSVKSFIENKGLTELISVKNGKLS